MTYDLSSTCLALELAQGRTCGISFLCQQFLGFCPCKAAPAPKKVLWAPTLGYAELDAPVARTLAVARQRLEEAGIEVVEVAGPFPDILSQVGGPFGRRRWRESSGPTGARRTGMRLIQSFGRSSSTAWMK